MSDTSIKLSEKLSQVLEIKEEQKKQEIIQDFVQDKDVHSDFEYARDVIKDMVKIGREAVDELNAVSKETQQARHYEVLATLIKTTTENAEKVLDIRKKKKEMEKTPADAAASAINNHGTVTNNTFIGTTADLLKAIRETEKSTTVDVTPEKTA